MVDLSAIDSTLHPRFNNAEIILYTFGAILFILDFVTDCSVLKSLLWVPVLYVPCLTFIVLPILVRLPKNLKAVRQLQWDSARSYLLNTLKGTLILTGFSPVLQIASTAKLMLQHKLQPSQVLYRSAVEEQFVTNSERLINLTFETIPQSYFQICALTLNVFSVNRINVCIPVTSKGVCPAPMFQCGNVCFPQLYICNKIIECTQGSTCMATYLTNSTRYTINYTNSLIHDEYECSQFSLFIPSIQMVAVSIAMTIITIVWTIVSSYNTSWLMYNIHHGRHDTISWKLYPILTASVVSFFYVKRVSVIIFYLSLIIDSGNTYLYLIAMLIAYICGHMLLLLYVRRLCKDTPGIENVTFGNIFKYAIMQSALPCHNLISLFPTNLLFHVLYYLIEYITPVCIYLVFVQGLDEPFCAYILLREWCFQKDSTSMISHLAIYSSLFVLGLLLYGLFQCFVGPNVKQDLQVSLYKLRNWLVKPCCVNNRVNVVIIVSHCD